MGKARCGCSRRLSRRRPSVGRLYCPFTNSRGEQDNAIVLPDSFFDFFKQKTPYEITRWLEFRRVLFRSGGNDQGGSLNSGKHSHVVVYVSGRASTRSEERRVGKECRSRWSPYH